MRIKGNYSIDDLVSLINPSNSLKALDKYLPGWNALGNNSLTWSEEFSKHNLTQYQFSKKIILLEDLLHFGD